MKLYSDIKKRVAGKMRATEAGLDVATLTGDHGVNSFQYDSGYYLRQVFDGLKLKDDDVFYDLGSGYGLVLFYGALRFPAVTFKGIEIVPERVGVCNEMIAESGLTNVTASTGDLLEADFSDGTVFYFFDPLFRYQYPALIGRLKAVAATKEIVIISESCSRLLHEEDWLTEETEYGKNNVHSAVRFRSVRTA